MTGGPPAAFANLQARLGRLLSASRAEVEHFSKDSWDGSSRCYGWGTQIRPVDALAPPLCLWLDGVDDDLVMEVGDFGWFEWRQLAGVAWEDEVLRIVAAVIEGRVIKRSRILRISCEITLEDGTVRRASSGRVVHFARPGTTRFPCYPGLG